MSSLNGLSGPVQMPWGGGRLLWFQEGARGRDDTAGLPEERTGRPARCCGDPGAQVLTVYPATGRLGCLGVFHWMLKAVQFSASSATCRGGPALPVWVLPKQETV